MTEHKHEFMPKRAGYVCLCGVVSSDGINPLRIWTHDDRDYLVEEEITESTAEGSCKCTVCVPVDSRPQEAQIIEGLVDDLEALLLNETGMEPSKLASMIRELFCSHGYGDIEAATQEGQYEGVKTGRDDERKRIIKLIKTLTHQELLDSLKAGDK